MTRRIKEYLFSIGLRPLWIVIKYGTLIMFHVWIFIKKLLRLLGINAIIVEYDISKESTITKKMILPFQRIIIPVIKIFNWWERMRHFDHTVYAIPYGKIFGSYTISSSDNKILRDVTRWHKKDKGTNMYAYNFLPKKTKLIKGNTAVLTWNDTDKNYHHRITVTLPKYYIIKKSWIPIDTYIVDTASGFHKETLAALWISTSQTVSPNPHTYYQCENLICTNNTTLYGFIQPWVQSFLRKLFLPHSSSQSPTKKLYIKRISTRKVANDEELERYMINHGFEIHAMEWMSIKQQAELFHQASVIVGPHGAGLTNIVFCKPWTTLIELFHPKTIFWHYYAMAASCWLKYIPIVGVIQKNPKLMAMDNDMIIDLKQINDIFEKCINM